MDSAWQGLLQGPQWPGEHVARRQHATISDQSGPLDMSNDRSRIVPIAQDRQPLSLVYYRAPAYTVGAALLASSAGAVALHDPTEGGLVAGLDELAVASGVRLRIDPKAIYWFAPGLAVCRALGVDPWTALASGALLAVLSPERATTTLERLRLSGYKAVEIGRAEIGAGVVDRFDRQLGGRPWGC